ncbi:hypothetical protein E2C01_035964 [Portunus trituberculatus]|uniref:Uncharacterized protein n=1 Tax=Portunus trituberculatus TaxID=210409 RepID=A0A5B7FCW4_PORTR|nr:hypothetical protein [Portunus trituberculatus]
MAAVQRCVPPGTAPTTLRRKLVKVLGGCGRQPRGCRATRPALAPNAGAASADGNAAEATDHGKGNVREGQYSYNALGNMQRQGNFLSRPPVI